MRGGGPEGREQRDEWKVERQRNWEYAYHESSQSVQHLNLISLPSQSKLEREGREKEGLEEGESSRMDG